MDNQRQQHERRVICSIQRGYENSESDIGKLRAFYEILTTDEIVPINSPRTELFCETEQVFVTGRFSELKDKFGDKLFEAVCIPTSFEVREGDCRYVTRLGSCSDIKGLTCCQIFDHPLPPINEQIVVLPSKPLTKPILLRDDENIYGPFDYSYLKDSSNEEHILKIKAITTPINTTTPSFHIGKIYSPQYIQSLYEKTGQPTLLGNIKKCFENAEFIDYISNDQIISTYGSKIAQNAEIRMFNKGTIAQIRKSFASSHEQRKFPERFKRLFEALEISSSWEGTRKDLIDSFLVTNAGKDLIAKYIDQHREDFFKGEKQAYIEKLENDHSTKIAELEELQEKKELIVSEIRKAQRQREEMELNNESTEALEALSKKHQEQFDRMIEQKKQELDKVDSQLTTLTSKYSELDTVEKLNDEIKYLERHKKNEEKSCAEMQVEVERVRAELKAENEKLTTRLLKLKPDVDALSGIAPRKKGESINYSVPVRTSTSNDPDEIRDSLIKDTLEALNKLGRKTDYNTVTNILTTVAQSQFTLFSGRPGTGKTSLAKMLGNSLGLQNRLLNIPVARGWTSSKDVLGFYNALSSSFNSSATGLYDLLTQLNREVKKKQEAAPAICLLDEFNLSQPEHYFSPFLEMSDPESKRIVATGDQEVPYLEIPQYLRFLGTINNDESVQALTPRMLDRASIISFDEIEPDYDLSLNTASSLGELDITPISGNQFIEAFSAKSLELPQDIDRTLKVIIDTLRDDKAEFGTPVNVSFRKVKAIRAYHNVTSSMYIDSRLTALDYSVSQHIIPLLNGYGKNFGQRLEQLKNVIPDEMELSQKMLRRIIDTGEQNMFTYGFNL
ncbi:AAA family ATPase [Vibrio vulnificus]|uniref:AAA family ATPase n=1 Tax=Vibrio vulnificus TaxID=672 RepID=UPI0005F0DA59|nr:AAA family ATPase [Vibrio vulnificus]ANN29155.1 5-methylcytosine-specific restriction related enzyme [Vibrio vulnificus]EHH0802872.1 AAA family ATPase [Vibrio vulnificus]POC24077.1 hypothetical protein CRN42_08865 [Vibrio vulnificus]HAS6370624.1 AAA family ATPase [Vibrio vulnificus]HAS8246988.1 AAA family ATPase [Vibrio vulnificus]